jgi:hypothetical protein
VVQQRRNRRGGKDCHRDDDVRNIYKYYVAYRLIEQARVERESAIGQVRKQG